MMAFAILFNRISEKSGVGWQGAVDNVKLKSGEPNKWIQISYVTTSSYRHLYAIK